MIRNVWGKGSGPQVAGGYVSPTSFGNCGCSTPVDLNLGCGAFWMVFCSLIKASKIVSGRGGQPGMYISTGITLSIPETVL